MAEHDSRTTSDFAVSPSAVSTDHASARSNPQKRENRAACWSKLTMRWHGGVSNITVAQGELMRPKPSVGIVAFSIYANQEQCCDFQQSRRLLDNARSLIDVFRQHQFPATWFISRAVAHLIQSRVEFERERHEVGISVDAAHFSNRAALSRELDRQLSPMCADGALVSSIAVAGGDVQQLDMLVKRGFTAMCSLQPAHRSLSPLIDWYRIESPRFGIWSMQPTLIIQSSGHWQQWASRRRAKLQLNRIAAHPAFAHFALELDGLSQRSIRRMLRPIVIAAAMLRDERKIAIDTLAGVVGRLTAPPAAQRTVSILRAA